MILQFENDQTETGWWNFRLVLVGHATWTLHCAIKKMMETGGISDRRWRAWSLVCVYDQGQWNWNWTQNSTVVTFPPIVSGRWYSIYIRWIQQATDNCITYQKFESINHITFQRYKMSKNAEQKVVFVPCLRDYNEDWCTLKMLLI